MTKELYISLGNYGFRGPDLIYVYADQKMIYVDFVKDELRQQVEVVKDDDFVMFDYGRGQISGHLQGDHVVLKGQNKGYCLMTNEKGETVKQRWKSSEVPYQRVMINKLTYSVIDFSDMTKGKKWRYEPVLKKYCIELKSIGGGSFVLSAFRYKHIEKEDDSIIEPVIELKILFQLKMWKGLLFFVKLGSRLETYNSFIPLVDYLQDQLKLVLPFFVVEDRNRLGKGEVFRLVE